MVWATLIQIFLFILNDFSHGIACNLRVPESSSDVNSWILRDSGVNTSLCRVVYTNGLLIAVGLTGSVTTSTDGLTWTQRTSPSTTTHYGVAYGNEKYVMSVNAGFVHSVDGITWTDPESNLTGVYGVSFVDGVFIAGRTSGLYNSADGINWTLVSNSSSYDVWYANDLVISCGANGEVAVSADGTEWTSVTSGTTQRLNAITYGNGLYVIVGHAGTIITSPDGITWTTRSSGITTNLWGVAYGNGMFLVADINAVMYWSANGVSWTVLSNPPPPFGLASGVSMCNHLCYSETLGMFIIVGEAGKIYTLESQLEFPCGEPTDTASNRCYVNTGRNTTSNASTETECALVCSNSAHYVANTTTGRCTLRQCANRSKNASESEPCGPGGCYWDQGYSSNSSRCISADTNCSNEYKKEPSNYTCFLYSCNIRQPKPDLWELRQTNVSGSLFKVIYGNGLLIAGGQSAVLTSTDGVTWTAATTPSSGNHYGLAYGNGKFVVSSSSTNFIHSVDGITWTNPGSSLTTVYGLIFVNGSFYAGGGLGIHKSTDGIAWTQVSSSASLEVFYANGLFLSCYTTGNIITSTDGTTWTSRLSPTTQRLNAYDYGNGTYVCVGYSGTIITSPDGITWTIRTSGTSGALWGVAYGNNMFLAVEDVNAVVRWSTDGVSWSVYSNISSFNLINQYTMSNHLAYVETLGIFIVVGGLGKLYTMDIYGPCGEPTDTNNNRCYVNTGRNTSSNASTETECALVCSNSIYYEGNTATGQCQLNACAGRVKGSSASEPCGPGGCYWDQGHPTNASKCIAESVDCSNKSHYKKDPSNYTCYLYSCETRVPKAAISNTNPWVLRQTNVSGSLFKVIYGNGLLVAGGQSAVLTSTDGVTWTVATTPSTGNHYGLAYGNGKFVVSSSSTNFIHSVNGITWTNPGSTLSGVYGAIFANGSFLAGAAGGIYKSTDGIAWTQVSSSPSLEVFYANGLYLSCYAGGAVSTSTDGTTWTSRLSGTTQRLNAYDYGSGLYVCVGYGGAIITSPDGITWTTRSSGTTGPLWGVAYGNGIFAAVEDIKAVVHWSADGVSWSVMWNASTFNLILQYTMANHLSYIEELGMFIAVGETGKLQTTDTVTRWRCGDNTDDDDYRCYMNSGRNTSSNAPTETVCSRVCSNSAHYGADMDTGECALRNCADRTKNASVIEPCGPNDCYWDQGHPNNASRCIDVDTNCTNEQYAKDENGFKCILDTCEVRIPNENKEKKCGIDCYAQPNGTCNVSCPAGLYPNNRGVCVCPLEHYVSEAGPCVYKAQCQQRSFHPDTPFSCGVGCFYGTNGSCSNSCLAFQNASTRNDCWWLDCVQREALSTMAAPTRASLSSSSSFSSPSTSFFTPLSLYTPSLSNPPPTSGCTAGAIDDPVPVCHYMADFSFYSEPPLTQCSLECPINYEVLTGPAGTYCERVACGARISSFGCSLPAEEADPVCFLNVTNEVCVEGCPLHAVPDEDGECQQLDCISRAATEVGSGGNAVLSCSHADDEWPCVWFADHSDPRYLEDDGEGGLRERHTECLSQCPHNYEHLFDEVEGHVRHYCHAKACTFRSSDTDCTLPGDTTLNPCYLLNEQCYSGCPFHTTPNTSLPIPECVPNACSTRQPNTGGDGLCRIHPGDECYRVAGSICAPHCGIYSIADEPADGVCVYTSCTTRVFQSNTCQAAGDPAGPANVCLYFADYATAPFNMSIAVQEGYNRVCQLANCPPNYLINSSEHTCDRIACPERGDANGCYLPGDGTPAANMTICRSFPDASLYGNAYSGVKCVNECPPNYNDVITPDAAKLITVHTCHPILDCASRTANPNCSLIIFGDATHCHVFADSPFFVDALGNEKAGYTGCVPTCPVNYFQATDNSTYPYPPRYLCQRQSQCNLRIPVNESCTLPGDSAPCYYNPVTQTCGVLCSENYVGSTETLPNNTVRIACKPVDCLDRSVSGGCALPGDEVGGVPKCFIPPVNSVPSLSTSLSSSFHLFSAESARILSTRADARSDANSGDDGNDDNTTALTCVLECPPFSSLATTPSAAAAGQCVYSACATRVWSDTLGCGIGSPACFFFPDFATSPNSSQCALGCPQNYVEGTEIDDRTDPPLTKYTCQRQGQCNLRVVPANQNCTLPGDDPSAPCYYDPVERSCSPVCSQNYAGIRETLSDHTIRSSCKPVTCLSRNVSGGCALPGDGTGDIPKCYTPFDVVPTCVLDCANHTEKDEGTRACMAQDCTARRPVSVSNGQMSCGTDGPHCFFVEEGANRTGCRLECPNENYEESAEYGNGANNEGLTGYFCKAKKCEERDVLVSDCPLPIDSASSETYPPCFVSLDGTNCVTACADFQVSNPTTHACVWVDCPQRTPDADGTCGSDSLCYSFDAAGAQEWARYLPCDFECPPNYKKETILNGHSGSLGYICTALNCAERNASRGCALPVDDDVVSPTCYVISAATSSSEPTCSTDCAAFQEPSKLSNACVWKNCETRTPIADPDYNATIAYTCGISTELTPFTCHYFPHYNSSNISLSPCVSTCPPNYEAIAVESSGGDKSYCKPLPCARRNYGSGCKLPRDGSEQPACYISPAQLGVCLSECPPFTEPAGADGITCITQSCANRSVLQENDGADLVPVCGTEQPPCFYFSGTESCAASCPQNYLPTERVTRNDKMIGYFCAVRPCETRNNLYNCSVPEDDPDTGRCFSYGTFCVSECPDGFTKSDTSLSCVSSGSNDNKDSNNKTQSSSSSAWVIPIVVVLIVVVVLLAVGLVLIGIFLYTKVGSKSTGEVNNNSSSSKSEEFKKEIKGKNKSKPQGNSSSGIEEGSVRARNRELEAVEGTERVRDHLHDSDSVTVTPDEEEKNEDGELDLEEEIDEEFD